MSMGGLRTGAGRPSGEPKSSVIIRLPVEVARTLRKRIPIKERSRWVEKLIVAAFAAQEA